MLGHIMLRQLIVVKCLPQPAETAKKVFNNHLFQPVHHHITQNYFLSLASWQPRKIFNFMRQPVPVTLLPLDISSVLARVAKGMMKPVSGTFTNSTALRLSQRLHLVTDHEYMLTSSSIFIHRRRHQTSMGFFLSISSVFIII